MILDKRAYLSLCLGSFFVALGAGFIAWSRWDKISHGPPPVKEGVLPDTFNDGSGAGTGWPAHGASAADEPVTAPSPAAPDGNTASAPPPAAAPAPLPPSGSKKPRNIRFTYRSSKPLKVEIVGNFNNWSPAAMTKGENKTWEISFPLEPGEYTYNFIADGKVVRDPNNPRTASEGRSLLVVQPLPSR